MSGIAGGGASSLEEIASNTTPIVTNTSIIGDGVSSLIKATVLDYTNSNPLAVRLTDTDGNYIAAGAGTQYADGAVRGTATGTLLMVDDGVNIQSVAGTSAGLLKIDLSGTAANATAIKVDGSAVTQPVSGTVTANLGTIADVATQTTLALIKSKTDNIPILGQALEAASVPVVLTATQLTTLTPPAAITGFATAAKQDTGNSSLSTIAGAISGTEMQVDVVTMPTTTVQATNLDIRDLTSSDVVTVTGGVGQVSDVKVTLDSEAVVLSAGSAEVGFVKLASGNVASGAIASGAVVDGAVVTLGTKADDKTTATDTTAVSAMSILKEISYMEQNPASRAVTNAGTFAVQAAQSGNWKLAASNDGVDIGNVDVASIAAGDNNIGNVDLASAIPAGTNAIGKLLPPDIDVTTHSNYARKYYTSAGAVTDGIIWSPAAGKRWHVTDIYIQVSAAATVTLEDDKAGGDDPVWKGELAANSGWSHHFDPMYPMASGEDAADLIVTTSAGNIYITVVGYEI